MLIDLAFLHIIWNFLMVNEDYILKQYKAEPKPVSNPKFKFILWYHEIFMFFFHIFHSIQFRTKSIDIWPKHYKLNCHQNHYWVRIKCSIQCNVIRYDKMSLIVRFSLDTDADEDRYTIRTAHNSVFYCAESHTKFSHLRASTFIINASDFKNYATNEQKITDCFY